MPCRMIWCEEMDDKLQLAKLQQENVELKETQQTLVSTLDLTRNRLNEQGVLIQIKDSIIQYSMSKNDHEKEDAIKLYKRIRPIDKTVLTSLEYQEEMARLQLIIIELGMTK